MPKSTNKSIDFIEIKSAAAGRWRDILPALTGLTGHELRKGASDHSCPLCGHKRIWPASDAEDTGSIACRTCTSNKPTGDGVGTIALFRGIKQGEAAALVAEYLGIRPTGDNVEAAALDIIELVCKAKSMPIEAFKQFGAVVAKRTRERTDCARVPVYDERGENRWLVADRGGSWNPGLRWARKASRSSPGATSCRQLRGSEPRIST